LHGIHKRSGLFSVQGIMVLTVADEENPITPPQLHMHLETLSSAGMFAISTVGAPGTHGVLVAGTQGMGVSTPNAAAVAAATAGLASELQTPKGVMFTMGTWSMMLAAGGPSHITLFLGRTTSGAGAAPKLQVIIAPIETWLGMILSSACLQSPRLA
jgi:hypothetical protein